MNPLRNDRGIALVITLLVVAILAITVLEFAFSVHVDAHMGRNALNSLQATLLARSGINLGEAMLLQDEEPMFDSPYAEDWGDEALLNSQFILPPNMLLKVRIIDESGKVNINATRPNRDRDCRTIGDPPPTAEYAQWLEVVARIDSDLGQALREYWTRACEVSGPVQQAPQAGRTPTASASPAPTPANEGTPTVDPLQIFVDFATLDDLATVLGIPARRLDQLRKVLTALPTAGGGLDVKRVNVNTASPAVLAKIIEDQDRLDELLRRREEAGLTTQQIGQIVGGQRQGQTGSINPSTMLKSTSAFFLIKASAIINPNPATGRGGVRRTASMLVQRSPAHGRPGGSTGGAAPGGLAGGGAGPRWTLKQLDWQKEGGAALFTERAGDEPSGESGLDSGGSGTRW